MKADSVASGSLTIGGTEARPVGEDTERLLGGGQNTCHNHNPHSVGGEDTERLLGGGLKLRLRLSLKADAVAEDEAEAEAASDMGSASLGDMAE